MERIGTLGDGGKWVCGLERLEDKKDCIIYSVGALFLIYSIFSIEMNIPSISAGVNGESSFEATLLQRAPGCQVYGYDFSVKSVLFYSFVHNRSYG